MRRVFLVVPMVVGLVSSAVLGSPSTASAQPDGGGPAQVVARPVAQVAVHHPTSDRAYTTVEGGAFGPDGELYVVDIHAPAGEPKVLRTDVQTGVSTPVYTDDTSRFSSLQFSPIDGRMYLTDLYGARIVSMSSAGTDVRTVASGDVDGRPMAPDDIAFDESGAMFVTDLVGTPFDPRGRVVRYEPSGESPTTVLDHLASPNGVSFTPDYSALWVSEYRAGREVYAELSEDGRSVADAHIGMFSGNGSGQLDSTAVDKDGNIYQAVFGGGRVIVWNSHGDLLSTVHIPQDLPTPQLNSSNVIIKPGTRDAYVTVGGDDGGYVFAFEALGEGVRQSNGG